MPRDGNGKFTRRSRNDEDQMETQTMDKGHNMTTHEAEQNMVDDAKTFHQTETHPMHTTLTYGDHSIDTAALPVKSIHALLRRGVSHLLGNEQSSKVNAEIKKLGEANGLTDDDKASLKAQFVAAAVAALHAGTLGEAVRGRASSGSALANEIARRTRAEVVKVLRDNKLHIGAKHPEDEKEFVLGGQTYTFGELQERWGAKNGERIKGEAEAHLDSEARAKAKAAKEAEGRDGQEVSVEDLGF